MKMSGRDRSGRVRTEDESIIGKLFWCEKGFMLQKFSAQENSLHIVIEDIINLYR